MVALGSLNLVGQSTFGTILGTVKDNSGAAAAEQRKHARRRGGGDNDIFGERSGGRGHGQRSRTGGNRGIEQRVDLRRRYKEQR